MKPQRIIGLGAITAVVVAPPAHCVFAVNSQV
jgi:hypothetical protein